MADAVFHTVIEACHHSWVCGLSLGKSASTLSMCMKLAIGTTSVFDVEPQGKQLICLAYGHGNITACINDGLANPMAEDPSPDDVPPNAALICIAVGRWPFLFVIAVEDIKAGASLACAHRTEHIVPASSVCLSVPMHLAARSWTHSFDAT